MELKLIKREDARVAILRAWRAQPLVERQTEMQASLFATEAVKHYRFRGPGDPLEIIKGWLARYAAAHPND